MASEAEGHGQDEEFTAEFDKLHSGSPSDQDRQPGSGKDGDPQAGADDAPADQQPGADPAPEPEVKDPWAGASPELIAERDRLQGELDRVKHSDSSQRGRISALTREITQLRQSQPEPRQPQGEDGKDGGEKDDDAEARAERLRNLREDYPDLAGPILDLIDEARNEVKALGGRVSPVIDANNEAAIQAQEQALAEKHPDWRDVGASQDFAGWAASQPAQIQALCGSFDAAEVSAALSLFKAARDASKAPESDPKPGSDPKPQEQQRDDRRDRQLQGGRERTSRPAPAASGAPDEFEGAFEFFRQKRERQNPRR